MVFSDLFFIYMFLPIVILFYFIASPLFRNGILLAGSLFFYAWGEPAYLFLMIFSILINYIFGLFIDKYRKRMYTKKFILTLAVLVNIGLLGYFKYANFVIQIINHLLHINISFHQVPLPIGISFYTFHALSYLIDVYRKTERAQRNILNLALYITFFPQLVAGPIIRYNDVADQLKQRITSVDKFVLGIQRFILGLSKKVMIANPLGTVADGIFNQSAGDLSTVTAWVGTLAYTLQIYFDFSGYSDMAIGLGKMFGFEFRENFNYPYISRSVSEFWRRWHISLGSWFRDYMYIPLGGNRVKQWKVYRNLLIVWTTTGFWHGASWTFLLWGFYYAVIICLEKAFLGRLIERLWRPLQHLYLLILVMIGWVFFRANNFAYSIEYVKTMFGFGAKWFDDDFYTYFVNNGFYFFIGIIFAAPVYPWLRELINQKANNIAISFVRDWGGVFIYLVLFLSATVFLVNSTYNPFIYFRF